MSTLSGFSVETQIAFAARLKQIESLHLADALAQALNKVTIAEIDREFATTLSDE